MKYLILCVAALLASCQSIPVGPDIQAGPKPNVRPPIAGIVGLADAAAADADADLPSGGLYRTTAGGRTVFAKP